MLYTYEKKKKKTHDHYEHINMEFVGNDLHVISNFQLKKNVTLLLLLQLFDSRHS